MSQSPPPEAHTRAGRTRAYMALLRPANVATALADVLAGAAVAGLGATPSLAWLLAATACLYAGGIVLNDYFDRDLDARERPERPIPSGLVPAARAGALGAGLLLAGIGAAAMAGPVPGIVAVAIAAAVLAYDAQFKPHPVLGPITMGSCRALNLLLGIAAAPSMLASHWTLGLLPLVYISAVTVVSRGEVHGSKRPVAWLGLALIVCVAVALALLAWSARDGTGPQSHIFWALALTAWLTWRVVPPFWRAAHAPSAPLVRAAVRAGVLSLVLVDSVIAASYTGIIYSLAVLATGLLAWWLARRFAVT